jgi:hypothetical protein
MANMDLSYLGIYSIWTNNLGETYFLYCNNVSKLILV